MASVIILFFAVEEPEAHLHPHIQRLVYGYFLGDNTDAEGEETPLTTILTTHSPHIASVTPIRSIVLLRSNSATGATTAVSTALCPLSDRDEADLQRYVDVTRGEIFFARGVILVEGDAERFLIPAFANALGISLDMLGISVCSVSGTNFTPYVKLLGPMGLDIPHVVLTDRDPVEGKPPLVRKRLVNLLSQVEDQIDYDPLDADAMIARAKPFGYFVNENTLEPELFRSGLGSDMKDILIDELGLRKKGQAVVQGWIDAPETLDESRLIEVIERVGKGRFAQALASNVTTDTCPDYIREALEHIRDAIA